MKGKMKEAEITIGSSIIRRLYRLLKKNSYNLTQDQEERVFEYAYKDREFCDGMIVAFIEGMRACPNRHVVEIEKMVTLPQAPVIVPIGSSSSGAGLQEEHITLDIKDMNGNIEPYRINCGTPLNNLVKAYCDRHSMEPYLIRLIFLGRLVRGEDTPFDLKLEDGFQLIAAPLRLFNVPDEV